MTLTPSQEMVLEAIRRYRRAHEGISPTHQEIADELGVSKTTVFGHVEQLRRKGYVRKTEHYRSRAIELVGNRDSMIREALDLLRAAHAHPENIDAAVVALRQAI